MGSLYSCNFKITYDTVGFFVFFHHTNSLFSFELLMTNKEPRRKVCLQLWLTNNLSSVVIFQRSDALSHWCLSKYYSRVTQYVTVDQEGSAYCQLSAVWTTSMFLLHISYTQSKRKFCVNTLCLEHWQIRWQTECHVSHDPLLLSVLSHDCESPVTVRYQIYINAKCYLGVWYCGWSSPLFISRLCVFVQVV